MYSAEKKFSEDKLRYLELLSESYPTKASACTEIINLKAILNLPKGTEHFISDVHGEFESFNHVIRNASGIIKEYINEIFGNSLRESEKRSLATLIYYPEQKIEIATQTEEDLADWYKINLFRIIQVLRRTSSKYTRSKVRKAMNKDFAYILEELLNENSELRNKRDYYNEIIDTIIKLNRASNFVVAISKVIHRLAVDKLHVIGDIYDRGPHADKILDALLSHHSLDIQWGNHDISWMGAAAGSLACICNVIRISAKYNNLDVIEESYGINLVPLVSFVMEHYKDDPCERFIPELSEKDPFNDRETVLVGMIHKAITIMQFKVEAALIQRRPEYHMQDRILLDKVDFERGTVKIDGVEYELTDKCFPTVNPKDPLTLTPQEKEVLSKLKFSFMNSEKLQSHAILLFNKGSMYKAFNSNLLFHGCIPLNEDGTLKRICVEGKEYSGKSYLDKIERLVRGGYFSPRHTPERRTGLDLMWYLWCGPDSPLFGKERMATFERYFVADKSTHVEKKDPYYEFRDNESVCELILKDFGLDPAKAHIVNGHVPVKVKKGESPVKANGRLIVIDGGFAKAYQAETGIAGYTLIFNSHGLILAAHEPFESTKDAIENEKDIVSQTMLVEFNQSRITVMQTDIGVEIQNKIKRLEDLLTAYNKGWVLEKEVY